MIEATEVHVSLPVVVAEGHTPSILTTKSLGIPDAGISVLLEMVSSYAMAVWLPRVASVPGPAEVEAGSVDILITGGHRVASLGISC